jgi:hypothetical protein
MLIASSRLAFEARRWALVIMSENGQTGHYNDSKTGKGDVVMTTEHSKSIIIDAWKTFKTRDVRRIAELFTPVMWNGLRPRIMQQRQPIMRLRFLA